MAMARNVEELDVYNVCDQLRARIRALLERPVFRKDLELYDQMDRCCESPCRNLNEGFGRYYPKDNAKFVRVGKGSLKELKEHLGKALAKHFIGRAEHDEIMALTESAKRVTTGYVKYLEHAKFPQPPSRRSHRPRRTRNRDAKGPEPGTERRTDS